MLEKLRGSMKLISINALVLAILFVVLEGISSATILGYRLLSDRNPGLQSRTHVRYDEHLGWANEPNLDIDDMYGPGRRFVTNSQSFRNAEDFPKRVPEGKRRIICSGDSFTLGIGVSNEDTFCARLSGLDARLETANLGEAGYGLDQIYLKYRREGAKLDHDLHLFAFISDDIRRMGSKRYIHYPKPRLVLRDGELFNDNEPVPRRSPFAMFFALNRQIFQDLRTVELANGVWRRLGMSGEGAADRLDDDGALAVAVRIFEEVDRLNREKGSVPVFVFLRQGISEPPESDEWRSEISSALEERGLIYIDLVEEFGRLGSLELREMFDPEWTFHYTPAAHQRVADLVYQRIASSL
jgi:hypothetical protein